MLLLMICIQYWYISCWQCWLQIHDIYLLSGHRTPHSGVWRLCSLVSNHIFCEKCLLKCAILWLHYKWCINLLKFSIFRWQLKEFISKIAFQFLKCQTRYCFDMQNYSLDTMYLSHNLKNRFENINYLNLQYIGTSLFKINGKTSYKIFTWSGNPEKYWPKTCAIWPNMSHFRELTPPPFKGGLVVNWSYVCDA